MYWPTAYVELLVHVPKLLNLPYLKAAKKTKKKEVAPELR